MIESTLHFVRRNMNMRTVYPFTDDQKIQMEYPLDAVKTTIISELLQRDYSIETERMPIQLLMFQERMEFHISSGIYRDLYPTQLDKLMSSTRNPVLTSTLDFLWGKKFESSFSIIQQAMASNHLPLPILQETKGNITVILKKNIV